MNFSNENHEIVRQNEKIVKKSQKHEANVQKNSTLYFQIGLILTLMVTYGLFEMQFPVKQIVIHDSDIIEDETLFVSDIVIYQEPKKEVAKAVPKRTRPKISNPVFTPAINTEKPESLTINTPTVIAQPTTEVELPKPPATINNIEEVPIYPGCEKYTSRNDQLACMSKQISKHINRKFNTDVATGLNMKGRKRVFVQFTIDRFGNVTDIKAKGPHEKLEREAIKAIGKIPQMKPGKQANKTVPVIYNVPIIVQILE